MKRALTEMLGADRAVTEKVSDSNQEMIDAAIAKIEKQGGKVPSNASAKVLLHPRLDIVIIEVTIDGWRVKWEDRIGVRRYEGLTMDVFHSKSGINLHGDVKTLANLGSVLSKVSK